MLLCVVESNDQRRCVGLASSDVGLSAMKCTKVLFPLGAFWGTAKGEGLASTAE